MDVVVVGAGISGLACAVRLHEAGCSVEVVAAEPPGRTTSAVAAALWYPYRAFPEREVTRWGAATYAVLAEMADVAGTGVRMRTGREIFNVATPEPWWRSAVPTLDRVPPADLPPGYVDGFVLSVPVVDSSIHLPWLFERMTGLSVSFRQATVTDLSRVAPQADVIVNCTGLGAAALLDDDCMVPIRGQIVLVDQVGLTEWLLADTDPVLSTYVVPREHTIVLGGTAEIGATDLEPDPVTAEEVHERCVALVPQLQRARVLAHRVGLRPARSAVRLEAGRLASGQPVVHNYGHGGAGWTLSYGCAAEVTELVLGTG